MGRPPTTIHQAAAIHAHLLEQGIKAGEPIPKPLMDGLLVRLLRISVAQVRNIMATGEHLGLWTRTSRPGNTASTVVLHEAPDTDALVIA